MAFENIEPFRDDILAWRKPGPTQKTLNEVCDLLFEKHKLRTTPGTLSRYLKEMRIIAPDSGLRDATLPERERLEAIALLTEVLVEIRGRSDEQRVAIEHLAGQVGIATRSIEDLEKVVAGKPLGEPAATPALIRQIWLRSLAISSLVTGVIAAAGLYLMRAQ